MFCIKTKLQKRCRNKGLYEAIEKDVLAMSALSVRRIFHKMEIALRFIRIVHFILFLLLQVESSIYQHFVIYKRFASKPDDHSWFEKQKMETFFYPLCGLTHEGTIEAYPMDNDYRQLRNKWKQGTELHDKLKRDNQLKYVMRQHETSWKNNIRTHGYKRICKFLKIFYTNQRVRDTAKAWPTRKEEAYEPYSSHLDDLAEEKPKMTSKEKHHALYKYAARTIYGTLSPRFSNNWKEKEDTVTDDELMKFLKTTLDLNDQHLDFTDLKINWQRHVWTYLKMQRYIDQVQRQRDTPP